MSLTVLNTCSKVENLLKNLVEEKLKAEIVAYTNLYKNNKELYKKAWELITYNEVAMVSLITTSFTRLEKPEHVWALQEYEVFNDTGKFKGRGDLFVALRKEQLSCDLIIEAKRDGRYTPAKGTIETQKELKAELEKTYTQGLKYYKHERKYFDKNTYIVSMFFGYLNLDDKDSYEKHKLPEFSLTEDSCNYQFYVDLSEYGLSLCVYGQIQKTKS